MKLSAIVLLVGLIFIGYASSLTPYKNEALFMQRYMALSDGQSNAYWKLRDEMLTPKFQLQDYGGTLVTIAVGVFLASRKGWRKLKTPGSRATLFWLAFAAPFLTVGAYVFELFQCFDRGEFPHWADSMGIPLMGVPVLLMVLLVWSGAHLVFLRGSYQSTRLAVALSRKSNWWLLSIAAITAMLVVLCASVGQYWYAIPGVFWLYFYISLAASRHASEASEPVALEGRYAGKPSPRL